MTEPEDHDDVDVFISPRRFGGRTPGPQATMQKVFEEEQAKSESQSAARDEDFFEGVKYKYNDKRSMDLKNVGICPGSIHISDKS